MNSFAYYNGNFGKRESINIPLNDRAIFFGDAVYDVAIGCYDRILWEEEHVNRLLYGAKVLGINHTYSAKNILDTLREVAVKSMLKSYLIYFQISRTSTLRKHSATNCGASLLITVDEFEPNLESPPMKLITVDDRRYGYCNVKTINLLPAVLSSTRAEESDCDEAIFVKDGYITECTKSNISIIKQGRLITHPNSTNILPGITRRHLLRVCDNMGLKFIEQPFTKEEIFLADEVLITSSTKLLRAASHVDNIPVGRRADDILQAIRQDLNSDYYRYVK